MKMQIDKENRELKFHGTYGFPVNVGRKLLSAYETGSFPWHWHDEVELTLALSGEMEYRVNDGCYVLRAGEGLFCNADALHAGSMHGGGDCDYVSLTFHPRFLRGFDGSVIGAKYVDSIAGSRALSALKLSPEVPWQKDALADLERIYRLLVEKQELYELEVQRLLLGIWGGLYRHYGEEVKRAPAEDPEKIERLRGLISFLHAHYREKVTLEDVARQVNLSKSECCRFFKRQMGKPLFDYLLDYRIGKSLALLKSGRTVAEAAAGSGFSNPAYYAKVFRARTGRSPSQYRKENAADRLQAGAEEGGKAL